jgi:protein-S-isoprenylcysteine O-methyltransferase Ste14
MYLGFVLILVGVAMLMGSLTPFTLILAFAILMDKSYIVIEEEMLAEKFNENWQVYAGQVRKWI